MDDVVGKERECSRLQTDVLTLKREIKDEKESRTKAVASLQAELRDSSSQVAHLENRLRAKKAELEGVVSRSEADTTHNKADMLQAKKQVGLGRKVWHVYGEVWHGEVWHVYGEVWYVYGEVWHVYGEFALLFVHIQNIDFFENRYNYTLACGSIVMVSMKKLTDSMLGTLPTHL